MDRISAKFTVFFEEPFWVGVYERVDRGKLEVCKVTFGSEPKDYEVYGFLQNHWKALRFSPAVADARRRKEKINPKRMQREINRSLRPAGVGTKAQQALKLQQEQGKQERKVISRQQKEEEADRRFQMRQMKRKEKHRGR